MTADALDELRPVAFGIAYRMLGSVSEAEDVVQETLLRVHREGGRLESPRAFAATVATRLSIDQLRSARARREQYVGDWLPEPVVTDDRDDPAFAAEMADSLSLALLVVLESLTPEQRAVLLLRDVFDYAFADIAGILGRSEDSVRQLAVRARKRVEERRPRQQSTAEQREELTDRFFKAVYEGDLAGLESLLASDVTLTGDGGGRVPALARRLEGRSRVAHTLLNWMKTGAKIPYAAIRRAEINGGPGALLLNGDGAVLGVWSIEIAGGKITELRSIVNPEKLTHLGPTAGWHDALKRGR